MNPTSRQELMENLYQNNEYCQLPNNKARVDYIFKNLMSFQQLKALMQTSVEQVRQKCMKNLSMAKNYMLEGDLYMSTAFKIDSDKSKSNEPIRKSEESKDLINRALHCYNQAILYMPFLQDIRMTSKLYTRKCQVHMELEQNVAALYSIETSMDIYTKFSSEEPEDIILFKIIKAECLKKIGRYQESLDLVNELLNVADAYQKTHLLEMKEITELIIQGGTQSVCVDRSDQEAEDEGFFSYRLDERCSIQQSPVVGRHFIAKEDIPEQTVILQEKPYSIIIENDYLLKKCSNCYKELEHRIYPCLNCTEILFCDRKCFEKAHEKFHCYECGMVSVLRNETSPAFHVFRMMSRVGPIDAYEIQLDKHNYSIDDYLKDLNQRIVPELQKTREEKLRAYKMSSILWDHDSKHSNNSNVHHVVLGIELAILLDMVHDIFTQRPDHDFKLNFISTVIVDIRRIIFNVFGWHEYNDDWSLRGHVANCQCLVGSLINHSCVPNTNWEFIDGQIRFTTNKLIEKGQEITITYGPNKDIPYSRRQERLNHYFFACHCDVCVADARKGKALKCDCNGPIPFDVPLNNEPQLSGQCLLCYKKYPDFMAKVDDYKRCQSNLAEIEKVVLLNPNFILLNQAKEMASRLSNLSVTPNSNIDQALFELAAILRRCDTYLTREELLPIVDLIDRFLSPEVDNSDLDTLNHLFYLFEAVYDYLEFRQPNSSNETTKQYQAWNCLNNFRKRILNILAEIKKDETNQDVKNIARVLKHNLNDQYKKFENEFSITSSTSAAPPVA